MPREATARATKPPAKDTRVTTSVRLDLEMLVAAKSLAMRQRRAVNDMLIELLEKYLTKMGYWPPRRETE